MIICTFPESLLDSSLSPFHKETFLGYTAHQYLNGSAFSLTYLFRGVGGFTSVERSESEHVAPYGLETACICQD